MKKAFLQIIVLTTLTYISHAQNLVINGDFTAGNTAFTNGYVLDCSAGPIGEQRYCVGINPNAVHGAWSACGDHTTGTGNMMILNGTSTPNVKVWEQTVAVLPNTCYKFCAWGASTYFANSAKLRLTINGLSSPTVTLSTTTCVWEEVCAVWNSGPSTSVTLVIWDDDLNPGGNDFAIDDISLIAISTPCTQTVLPIKINSVNAKQITTENVLVQWDASEEINVAKYIVENSVDGVSFESIGTVNPISNTVSASNKYSFIHKKVSQGQNYYRIKEQHTNGLSFNLSEIVKLIVKADKTILPKAIVTNNTLYISNLFNTNNSILTICDITGRKILAKKIAFQNNLTIDIAGYSNGLYLIYYSDGESIFTQKFVKN